MTVLGCFIFIIYSPGVTIEEEKGEDQPDKVVFNDDPFHPTHEWQAVKEGKTIRPQIMLPYYCINPQITLR
jgi:hypothetical protein